MISKIFRRSEFFKNIRALRIDLSILFIISIATIILIDFWLIDIPELFHGGERIGNIVYKLCFSYVSAFIFYFLVVHVKNQKDKKNLNDYIAKFVFLIINQAKTTAKDLASKSKIDLKSDYPSKDELAQICKLINPNSEAPLILGLEINSKYANWIQYFENGRLYTLEHSNKILSKLNFLDSELVRKLAKIEDNKHYVFIKFVIKAMPIKNSDLTNFESSIADYFVSINELELYYNKKLKEYKK